ncbi:hypothetical protein BpHYR1_012338 [Brachionus plicatilis]|uniref:Uncharacterized protein n=1 Tax=Brachionus plicatilis TaxID=10195 RepID=A0A3M7PVD6_BRAPC|nr:hypothetical protein BpHYR1_012338 [Brachionus plicatilis]
MTVSKRSANPKYIWYYVAAIFKLKKNVIFEIELLLPNFFNICILENLLDHIFIEMARKIFPTKKKTNYILLLSEWPVSLDGNRAFEQTNAPESSMKM